MNRQAVHERWMFIPIAGIALFLILYAVAANHYPGGSNASRTHDGFDWINNYWCDLLAPVAKNGSPNSARAYALTGMILLFSSLAVFWYHLPRFFHERKLTTVLIRSTGSISMFILLFVFTRFHDGVIGIGSSISIVPVATTLTELNRSKLKGLYISGWVCILLILLNFYIYLTNWWIAFLPLLQKITLLLFLVWILLTNFKLLKISRKRTTLIRRLFS